MLHKNSVSLIQIIFSVIYDQLNINLLIKMIFYQKF